MQHRQEDSHAVYVRSKIDASNAKHRQEHGHAVYVEGNKKCGVINKVGHKSGHTVPIVFKKATI